MSSAAAKNASISDAAVFSRGCKPAEQSGVGGSDVFTTQAILYKWSSLRPQSEDRLVKLDVDLIHVRTLQAQPNSCAHLRTRR